MQNIQKAAEKLFVTRQGVSKVIRFLEEEIGQILFMRSSKGLVPTDFANALLSHAQKLLEEYNFIMEMQSLASQKKNVVVIYAIDHFFFISYCRFF